MAEAVLGDKKIKVLKLEPLGQTMQWLTYSIDGVKAANKIRVWKTANLEVDKEYEGKIYEDIYKNRETQQESKQIWFKLPGQENGGKKGGNYPRTDAERNAIEKERIKSDEAKAILAATVQVCIDATPQGQQISDECFRVESARMIKLFKGIKSQVSA